MGTCKRMPNGWCDDAGCVTDGCKLARSEEMREQQPRNLSSNLDLAQQVRQKAQGTTDCPFWMVVAEEIERMTQTAIFWEQQAQWHVQKKTELRAELGAMKRAYDAVYSAGNHYLNQALKGGAVETLPTSSAVNYPEALRKVGRWLWDNGPCDLVNDGSIRAQYDAAEEIERLQRDHRRYELLRTFSVQQFKDLYETNLRTGRHFDKLVDDVIAMKEIDAGFAVEAKP